MVFDSKFDLVGTLGNWLKLKSKKFPILFFIFRENKIFVFTYIKRMYSKH